MNMDTYTAHNYLLHNMPDPETNYIRATVSLFVALYNLFVSLLHIIMMFAGGSRD